MNNINRKIWKRYLINNRTREYYNYRANQISNTVAKKPYIPKYTKFANRRILSFTETNDLIRTAILTRKPFWGGRYGWAELQAMVQVINKSLGLNHDFESALEILCNNAGFFPDNSIGAEDFTQLMLDAYPQMDLHAIWPQFMEDYFIDQRSADNMNLTLLGELEPWNVKRYTDRTEDIEFWTSSLKQKRVLVIHPFADTIREQYKKKNRIFERLVSSEKILPSFDLLTLKAVQTSAGERDNRFNTWFDALKYMTDECRKIDFDVAIVGCGAYGFPLSYEIKKMGRVAIHLGGATQLMFGIMGKRWENDFKDIVNDSWTRPKAYEKIKNSALVEDSCYW